MGRIGMFGGTFDPPHIGHLIVAQDAAERLSLDRILLVPARVPPHKTTLPLTPTDSRVRMLEAAVGRHPRLEVSRIEVERPGTSYTVDTLRLLREGYPKDEICLLIGADQLRLFDRWRGPDEIQRLARLVVMAREGSRVEGPEGGSGVRHEEVAVTRVDISSREVRRRVEEGRSIRYWVPESVRRIIEEEQLYTRRSESREGTC